MSDRMQKNAWEEPLTALRRVSDVNPGGNGDSSAASKWGRRRLNPANCSWWKLLNQQDTYREDTRWGKAFRHKFRVLRTVFDSVLERALKEPRFSDLREPGHKKKGLPRHPLKIKLAAWFRVLREPARNAYDRRKKDTDECKKSHLATRWMQALTRKNKGTWAL